MAKSNNKNPTFIYTRDGTKKVNLAASKLLGDVLRDKNIDRQGDKTQLWKTKNGQYFTGSCLEHVLSSSNSSGSAKFYHPILITEAEARAWVTYYYGGDSLVKFGFADAEEL